MAFLNDNAVNALFDYIESNADRLIVPEATSGILGEVDVGSADYTRSSTTDGRKTQPAEAGFVAQASGTDNWIAQVDDDGTELLQANPVPSPANLTEGLAYNLSNAFLEAQDPA
jgi:hypothetical protein